MPAVWLTISPFTIHRLKVPCYPIVTYNRTPAHSESFPLTVPTEDWAEAGASPRYMIYTL